MLLEQFAQLFHRLGFPVLDELSGEAQGLLQFGLGGMAAHVGQRVPLQVRSRQVVFEDRNVIYFLCHDRLLIAKRRHQRSRVASRAAFHAAIWRCSRASSTWLWAGLMKTPGCAAAC